MTDDQRAQEVLKVLQALDPYAPKAAVHFDLQQRGYRPAPTSGNLLHHYAREGGLVAASKSTNPHEEAAQSSRQQPLLRNNFNFTDRGMHTTHLPPRSRATATDEIPRSDAATVCDAAAIHDVQHHHHHGNTGEQVLGTASAVVERLVTHNVQRELLIDFKVGGGGCCMMWGGGICGFCTCMWDVCRGQPTHCRCCSSYCIHTRTCAHTHMRPHTHTNTTTKESKTQQNKPTPPVRPICTPPPPSPSPQYFDDPSPLPDCALLPLWDLSDPSLRGRAVTVVVCNPHHADLVAVGYGCQEFQRQLRGAVGCWSLKQPGRPERLVKTPCGGFLLVVGGGVVGDGVVLGGG